MMTLTMKIVKYATNESLNYDFNTLMSLGFVTIPSDNLTKILSSHNLPKPAYILEYGGNKGGIKKLWIVSLEFTFVLIFLIVICM